MRVRARFSIAVTQSVLIIDPVRVFPQIDVYPYLDIPPDVPRFDDFGGDGNFKVYRSDRCIVVDTAPRQFKPRSRLEFSEVSGSVYVDSGMIVVIDASRVPSIERHGDCAVVCDLPAGKYAAWCEENENSFSQRRVILGIGREPQLFLAGGDATTINQLEDEVAVAIRQKGVDRQKHLEQVREKIMELHLSGSKDRRLEMLASAVKLDLPARRGKRFKR